MSIDKEDLKQPPMLKKKRPAYPGIVPNTGTPAESGSLGQDIPSVPLAQEVPMPVSVVDMEAAGMADLDRLPHTYLTSEGERLFPNCHEDREEYPKDYEESANEP